MIRVAPRTMGSRGHWWSASCKKVFIMLQEFDRKVFQHSVSKSFTGSERSSSGRSIWHLWQMYQGLKNGKVQRLARTSCPGWRAYGSNGYGAKVFGIRDIKRSKPSDVENFGLFRSPLPTGGGPLWLDRDSGMEMMSRSTLPLRKCGSICAETQLAVNRAVVETWKALQEMIDPATGAGPLLWPAFTVGFNGMMGVAGWFSWRSF